MGLKLVFILLVCLIPCGMANAQEFGKMKLMDSISVSFDSGSSRVLKSSQLISRLNETKILHGKIELIAYTDTVGSFSYNKNLASSRLLAVSKLLQSTRVKGFLLDSINENEGRRKGVKTDDKNFRRVDILIYTVEAKIQFDVPINLRINFVSGTDNIVMSSTENLKILEMLMKTDPDLQIKLNGHVCCEADMDLSKRRADRVKSYLISHGIDMKRITCKGYSNTAKLVPESTEENKRKNMRVDVVFVKPGSR